MNIIKTSNNTVPTGNQVANTTVKTVFSDNYLYPANNNNGDNVGRAFNVKGYGYISSISASAGTLEIGLEWGSTNLGLGVINLPINLSNAGFFLDAKIMICNTGTSGRVACSGFLMLDNAGSCLSAGIVNTGTLNTSHKTINTQLTAIIGVSSKFSVANAGNIITMSSLSIQELY